MLISLSYNHDEKIILNRGFTDFVKFLSAIMIAVGHYSGYALYHSENLIYRIIPMFSGNVGVALFFFISGYGLMMSELSCHMGLWPFIKKRLFKVYLPVVLVSFIWQLILLSKTGGAIDGDRVLHILYATFWGFSDGILWFVKAIMICYILFRIYIALHNSVVSLIVGTIIVYLLIYHLFADWAAISIPLFSLGVLVADYNEDAYKYIKSYKVIILLLLITILMISLYFWQGNLYLKSLGNWYIVTIMLFICAIFNVDINAPQWMNGLSYDIYITHNKVINYLRPLYSYIGFFRFALVSLMAAIMLYVIRKIVKV